MLARPSTEAAEFDRLMRDLGCIIFEGNLLERAILADIRRLRLADGDSGETSIRTRGAFSERLAEWTALVSLKSRRKPTAAKEVGEIASQAERLCRIRNLLTHHFAGIEEDANGTSQLLVSDAGISSVRTSQPAFTSRNLEDLIAEMGDLRERISRLRDIIPS